MKKTILSILLLTLILPLLISCRRTNNKKGVVGTDAAKLLLAQERLNVDVINSSSNLFTLGEEAFNKVARETRKYARRNAGRPNEAYTEVEGDTYKWYNDIEYSNFNSFFESYSVNIESSAEAGANLISYVKKNIRVVDVWVEHSGLEYLLKVDKTSETIYTRDKMGGIEICKRTTDENGNDVYELLKSYPESTVRMKYIPGLLYEFSIVDNNPNGFSHYLVANKSKGYWNIISTSDSQVTKHDDGLIFESFSLEALMMKEEGFYKFNYTIDNQGWSTGNVDSVTLISSDGKTDLVTIGIGSATLFNTGIKGLDHLEITAPKEYVGDFDPNDSSIKYVYEQNNVDSNGKNYKIYSTSGSKSAVAVLENGESFTEDDKFVNNKVTVGRIDVSYVAGCDAYGVIPLRIDTNNLKETFDILVDFLNETKISFKRDLETVLKSSEFALNDVKNFSKYFQFNGYNIDTLENAKLAVEVEKEKVISLKESYDEVKDAKVINYKNQNELQKNIYFADVKILDKGTINNTNLEINISNFKVKVDDTILFIEGEKYEVVFALLKTDGSIIPLDANNDASTTFVKNSSFEASKSTKINIPVIDAGTYALIAYVATSNEGIRVSKPVSITGEFSETSINQNGIRFSLTTNNDKNLLITSEHEFDIYLNTDQKLTFDELVHHMEQSAYNHGMINESIVEYLEGTEWKVLEKTDELIESGQYRMKYIVTLDNASQLEGYIYLTIE